MCASSAATAAQSTSASSGHSVTRTTASAPAGRRPRRSRPARRRAGRRRVRPGPRRRRRRPRRAAGPASTNAGASRVSSVFGLKASPSSAMRLPRNDPRTLCELADHPPLLELVDLDDGVQHLEVVSRVRRELLERERVLREAAAAEADRRRGGSSCRSGGRSRCPRRPSRRRRPSPRRRSRSR